MSKRIFAARLNGLSVTITQTSVREDAWAVRAGKTTTLGILATPACEGPRVISPMRRILSRGRALGRVLLVRGRLGETGHDGFEEVFNITNITTRLINLRDVSEVRGWVVDEIADALRTFARPTMQHHELWDNGVTRPASMANISPNGREFGLAVERFRQQSAV